jgi:hypothetical protein
MLAAQCLFVRLMISDEFRAHLNGAMCLQLACCKHPKMCARVLGAQAGQEAAAVSLMRQALIKTAMQAAHVLATSEPHSAEVGLRLLPTSSALNNLLLGVPLVVRFFSEHLVPMVLT